MTPIKRSFQQFIEWITASTFRKWVAASTISWMFAAMFGAICRDLAWHNLNINVGLSIVITAVAVLVFGGVSTSITQGKILRSATDEASQWGKLSLKGWAVGTLVGGLIAVISLLLLGVTIAVLIPGSGEAASWGRPLAFAILAVPMAAALAWVGIIYFVGKFQSRILDQLTQQNSHWVKTTLKSATIGLFVVLSAMLILRTRGSSIGVLGILGAIYGMITGAITGSRLTSLLFLEAEKKEVANT
jgi:hypothetical protein